ncbi:LysM peptidoglycan-binding domain-containing protein [Tetragenococcus koreensis]|uniref:LysM peptidoglycan-binding domain-containing protein n=1 Tax=Tetragenococcus koreensis TaxID=290335 RepID=UPI001F33FD85|nr:LysM peptidoglycan-binding domain-containing protein [Tetragenococcus koreensis]MCF1616854.1 LysM peptidoglycan-binding domain-containing protein [Tetragenococcus koreensis]
MKLKKLLLGTALTAGTVFAIGTTSANADEMYTIQTNDTLGKISKEFVGDKSLVDPIVEANDIKDKNLIYVGEELTIPTDGNSEQAPVQQEAPAPEVQEQPEQQVEEQPEVSEEPVVEEQPVQEEAEEPETVDAEEQAASEDAEELAAEAEVSNDGSTKAQFLAAGGTEEMWNTIVMPESGGRPDAVSPNGYQGLGQTKESWGTGSVEEQTKGMINYANDRYGSVEQAVSFRSANNWW